MMTSLPDAYEELSDTARVDRLLPPIFKWIGLACAAAGVAAYFVFLDLAGAAAAQYAGGTICALGLGLATFAREPGEDELTRKLRLEAAYWTGIMAVCMPLGANIVWFILEGDPDLYSGTGLVVVLLMMYLVKFHAARGKLAGEGEAA